MQMAKDYIAKVDRAGDPWTGPTTGPKARARSWSSTSRPISATAARRASATAPQEAAKAMGWDFRILDGQGSVPGRARRP